MVGKLVSCLLGYQPELLLRNLSTSPLGLSTVFPDFLTSWVCSKSDHSKSYEIKAVSLLRPGPINWHSILYTVYQGRDLSNFRASDIDLHSQWEKGQIIKAIFNLPKLCIGFFQSCQELSVPAIIPPCSVLCRNVEDGSLTWCLSHKEIQCMSHVPQRPFRFCHRAQF